MSTLVPLLAVRAVPTGRTDRFFYSGMAIAVTAFVFIGFSRTYYLRSYFDGPKLTLLRVVHGTVFTAWMLFFVMQTLLVAARRTAIHRRLGMAGAGLAVAMVLLGCVMAVQAAREGRAPPGMEPRAFLAIPLFYMVVFAPLVAAGIYFRRDSEMHKRLMLLATVSLAGAAAGRLPPTQTYGPLFFFGMVDLLVLAGPVYDLVTRHRIHRAYVWGGLLIILSQPLRLAVSGTTAWLAFANLLTGQ